MIRTSLNKPTGTSFYPAQIKCLGCIHKPQRRRHAFESCSAWQDAHGTRRVCALRSIEQRAHPCAQLTLGHWSLTRGDCALPPRGTLEMSGDCVVVNTGEGCCEHLVGRGRKTNKHAQGSPYQTYQAPNVNTSEVAKACSKAWAHREEWRASCACTFQNSPQLSPDLHMFIFISVRDSYLHCSCCFLEPNRIKMARAWDLGNSSICWCPRDQRCAIWVSSRLVQEVPSIIINSALSCLTFCFLSDGDFYPPVAKKLC